MSNKKKNLLIACACMLITVVFSMLIFVMVVQSNFSDKIVIRRNKKVHEILEVSDLCLIPGKSKDYEVDLTSRISGNFTVTLDYNELEDDGLKNYVDVKNIIEGNPLYEGKLNYLFEEGVELCYDLSLTRDYDTTILITYSMDEGISNEAGKTFSDFYIDLLIKRNNDVEE